VTKFPMIVELELPVYKIFSIWHTYY